MTPQQKKADELVERFSKHVKAEFIKDIDGGGYDLQQYHIDCIQCAIICVEREIEALDSVLDSRRHFRTIHENEVYDERKSVLNELKSRL
jgi:hypothetical protein